MVLLVFTSFGYCYTLDPLGLMLIALLAEGLIGDPVRFLKIVPHPVQVVGRGIAFFERKLNRKKRSATDLVIRGGLLTLLLAILGGIAGRGIMWLSASYVYGWVVELLLMLSLLAQRSLYTHVAAVYPPLCSSGKESLASARKAVSHIVGRETRSLDKHGVVRASIESLAENFSDGVIAPVFWYLLLGMPGIIVYKIINTMDSMIGYKNERYLYFGSFAARTDDILNFIPARLSGGLIVIASCFLGGTSPFNALKIMWRDARKHASPNAGWPESAMAGALGLALRGPCVHEGKQAKTQAWIGEEGRAMAMPGDLKKALYLYITACLIHIALVGLLVIITIRF